MCSIKSPWWATVGVAAIILGGCAGPAGPGADKAKGTVSGTIKQKGQPVPANTTVTFLGDDGVAAIGTTDGTGHYELKYMNSAQIPVGSYKVSVTPYNPADSASADPAQFFDPVTGESRSPQVETTLPDKYFNPTTSGIVRDVTAGNNTIDIDLPD